MTDDAPVAGGHSANPNNGMAGWLPIAISGALFLYFLTMIPAIAGGGRLFWTVNWVPSMNISLSFMVDGLSLTFALLISGIGTAVTLYSNTYLAGNPQYDRFALFLTSFMLAMLGLVLADDLIALFVFWELTTLTSYMLIGFSHNDPKSRRNALQALLVTGAGAMAFLAGLVLIAMASGTMRISEILAQGDAMREHALYLPMLILLLAGAFTKSAQMPFHFWLPNAMAAPTPVSAFLHSATMVKAGIYIMARMHPAFSGTPVWLWTLTLFGAATAVFASVVALRQTDLKQALAYTTLMALGTLTMLLGHSSAYALTAFATFLIVHSFYKAALFLVVGAIDKATGTREAALLGGLRGAMPVTAAAAALAALSMAGIPPLLGFIAKELMYAGAAGSAASPVLVVLAALTANALMFAVAGIVAFRPFWRNEAEGPAPKSPIHDVPWPMLAGPLVLAVLGLLFGLLPGLAQSWLVHPTVTAVAGAPVGRPLHLWGGFNLPLLLSLLTFVLGWLIYLRHADLRARIARLEGRLFSFDHGWDAFMDGFKHFAAWLTRLIQTGRMHDYLSVTFLTIFGIVIVSLFRTGLPLPRIDLATIGWMQLGIAALIIIGAITAAMSNSRIAAITALAVVGIGVALIFISYGAPDVAITQLMIETLVVVLLAVAMLRLPRLGNQSNALRGRDLTVAVATGGGFSMILLSVLSQDLDRRLTDYFEIASWPDAFGRNIVNVILVDFRALDTFGEITVVTIAALGAVALLRMKIAPPENRHAKKGGE